MPPPADPPAFRYRRLPGRPPAFRLASNASSRLWLGDDHLLQVQTTYFSETYKRYAYGDIQALLLRETGRALVTNIILAVLATGSGLLLLTTTDEAGRGFCIGSAAFWVLLLIVNLGRGKTCRCQLQTAAGPHPLSSLSRVRPARRALRLIAEKVAAAQGVPGRQAAEKGPQISAD